MKVKRTDAHDRFLHFTKQDFDIGACCQDLLNQRPFGDRGFYIFAHQRTEDDGFNKRIVWQPRLIKPKAVVNSMLFKGKPGSDVIKVIWIIPPAELWQEYQFGKMMGNKTIVESINDFQFNRKKLEAKEDDDPTDKEAREIYLEIRRQNLHRKRESGAKI